jgi:hypothetical protein
MQMARAVSAASTAVMLLADALHAMTISGWPVVSARREFRRRARARGHTHTPAVDRVPSRAASSACSTIVVGIAYDHARIERVRVGIEHVYVGIERRSSVLRRGQPSGVWRKTLTQFEALGRIENVVVVCEMYKLRFGRDDILVDSVPAPAFIVVYGHATIGDESRKE